MPYVRRASHAGSWYAASREHLCALFDDWLSKVPESAASSAASARTAAILCPHAGYRFSGPVAAHAFAKLQRALSENAAVRRILVLGPSHKVALSGVAIASGAGACDTPLGQLRVDSEAATQLARALPAPLAREMSRAEDEAEHSLEMQLPFLAHAAALARGPHWADTIAIVPIMVGRLSGRAPGGSGTVGDAIAAVLAPWLADPANLFVISSDFCHYGERFDFEPFRVVAEASAARGGSTVAPASSTTVADRIEALDREGMALIEAGDAGAFEAYIERTGNTICGRNPISLLLRAAAIAKGSRGAAAGSGGSGSGSSSFSGAECSTKFLAYAQSSRAVLPDDSSVSYAAAVVTYSPVAP